MAALRYELVPIGRVQSTLTDTGDAPRQGDEGAPSAWLILSPEVAAGLAGLQVGDELVVLTWLDRARRGALTTRPRGDPSRPESGVFITRSADRPNPIGIHPVQVVEIDGPRVRVDHLEAINGTPIVDLKPVLGPIQQR